MEKKYYTLEMPQNVTGEDLNKLASLYAKDIEGLSELYTKGMGGLCLGTDNVQSIQDMFRVFNDVVSLPENYHNEDIPQLSEGRTVKCILDTFDLRESNKYKTKVLFRNTWSELMEKDEGEQEGEAAAALMYSLYKNGWMPHRSVFRGKNKFQLNSIELTLVEGGDVFIEVEVIAKDKCKVDFDVEFLENGDVDFEKTEKLINA
jgi:hypothetical protein|tara:strand:+ start:461 stop:1072 length:612 start_codon:yes stop_codon:yes gene_type:complete